MKHFSMKAARNTLRAAISQIEPAAVDWIDWDMFESEMDEVMKSSNNPAKEKVTKVFAHAATRARMAYRNAVKIGTAWKQ